MAAGDPGSPARYYSSTAVETSLQSSIAAQSQGASNTSFIVASVSGFPSSLPYTLIVDPDTSKEEVVTVTAASSTTLTVTRGADNTQAVAHSAGAVVRHGVSGRDFRESQVHIAARGYDTDSTILATANQTHVHGIATGDGDVVGTSKTQTLSNKTLSNPIITGVVGNASLVFEGATADAHETTLEITDPTADRIITLPDLTGTVMLRNATETISNKTLGSNLNAGGYKVTNLATPTDASDAVRKDFADAQVAAAATSAASAATSATSAAASATAAAASVATIASYATASANSASAAATSATSAATSATSAAASATASASSASAAATSATSAATSATSSATSATAAATSATSAAASATAAATSATSAATSATESATSASAAATSASSAATSATSSATSATASATSASAAATSATSAAASATAAATSASSASTSASSALTSANSAATSAASAAAAVAASFDAKGDLLVGTGAQAFDQLTVATTAGYILAVNSSTSTGLEWVAPNQGDITGVTAGTGLTGGGSSGTVTLDLDTTSVYVVPSQATHSGKYLTTDGSAASWATVDALPSQTGNSGKYLTTNGTTASWATITTDPTPTALLFGGM